MRFTPFFLYRFLWTVVTILFLNACVSDLCETKSDPQLRVSFVKITSGKEASFPVIFTKISAKEAVSTNDTLSTTKTAISGIRLPLSQAKDTTTFVFKRADTLLKSDELILTYTRRPYFISQACGFEIKYDNISVVSYTSNTIADVTVVQPSVNAQINDVNIKVYFTK